MIPNTLFVPPSENDLFLSEYPFASDIKNPDRLRLCTAEGIPVRILCNDNEIGLPIIAQKKGSAIGEFIFCNEEGVAANPNDSIVKVLSIDKPLAKLRNTFIQLKWDIPAELNTELKWGSEQDERDYYIEISDCASVNCIKPSYHDDIVMIVAHNFQCEPDHPQDKAISKALEALHFSRENYFLWENIKGYESQAVKVRAYVCAIYLGMCISFFYKQAANEIACSLTEYLGWGTNQDYRALYTDLQKQLNSILNLKGIKKIGG